MTDTLLPIAAVLVLWFLVAMPVAMFAVGFCALNSRFDEWESESESDMQQDDEVRKAA